MNGTILTGDALSMLRTLPDESVHCCVTCGPTRARRDVWTVATRGFPDAHFATFPPDLIRPCILAGCPQGGAVLDPFFGSGTVGQVCIEEGRNFLGIELNPEYVAMAERRIANARPHGPQQASFREEETS